MGKSQFLAPAAGALAALMGVAGVAGVALDVPLLTSFLPTLPAVQSTTALGLVVAGTAVLLLGLGLRRRFIYARILSLVLFLLVAEMLFDFSPGLGSSLPQEPGRLSVSGSALGLLLVSVSLWLRSKWAVVPAVIGLAATFTILVSYLLQAPSPISFGVQTTLSAPGLLGLMALFVGVLGVWRHTTWLRWMFASRHQPTRLLLAGVVALPVALALLVSQGAQYGLYSGNFHFALYTLATVASLIALVIWNARRIERIERQRRTAAAIMRLSEQRTRLATMQTGIGVWDYNCDTGALYVSEEARRLLGFRELQVIDRTVLAERVSAADIAAAEEKIGRLLASDGSCAAVHEFRLTGRHDVDGEGPWLVTRASVVRQGGRVARVVGSVIDISDRKAAEERLEEAHRRLELAINAADIGMWDWNIHSGAIVWSRQCHLITGISPEEFGGTRADFLALVHPEDLQESMRAAESAVRERQPLQTEFRIIRPDGQVRWIQNRGGLVLNQAGEPVRLIGTMIDITARKEAEAEREALLSSERAARTEADRVARAKDDFLAMISHELRTPLNAIMGWVLLLRRPGADPQLLADGLKVIERNARTQAQLITDLFEINRLMSGHHVLDLEPVDINEIVRSAVASMSPNAREKGVTVEAEYAESLELVEGDARRLQQVVMNLLANALKFTPRDGSVRVCTDLVRDAVEIRVRDTGEGIDPKVLPHLFQRFRQGDTSTSRRHGGLGLGLAITKELVELHGGAVAASSDGKGRGSEFVVRIPVLAASRVGEESTLTRTDTTLLRPDSLQGTSVLAVDDQPDALNYLSRVLEQQGAAVTAVTTADEALQALRSAPGGYDVLVSDIGMPGTSGYDLIHTVRRTLCIGAEDLPAIAVTAFARDEDQQRSIDSGFQAHIAKPVHVVALISAVRELAFKEHLEPVRSREARG